MAVNQGPQPTVSYPTKLAETFAQNAITIYYADSVSESITNQDYEGEIKDRSSILNILTFGAIKSHTYTGGNMGNPDDLSESAGQLKTDQAIDFYFKVKSFDKFRSFIKNPENPVQTQVARELKKVIDLFVLGKYTAVAAGNRIGTNVTAGTVQVDAAGNVTGTNTAFTSAMVGRGFKAAGQTSWYRILSVANGTTAVIVLDSDDETNTYNGGAIGAGATYQIEAVTPLQVTPSTIYDVFNQLGLSLDNQEIPEDQRNVVISPDIYLVLKEAPQYIPSGSDKARDDVVINGKIGSIAGFRVWKSTRLTGDNTNGFHCLAGHKSAITYAMGLTENGMEDLIGNFGKAYKSLYVFGAKVVDERRKSLTELFCIR